MSQTLNQLHDQASPYLRRHADHPVAWQPWGTAALEQARRLHRPILLSLGYAGNRQCRRLLTETFADPAVTARLDESYVCILVDRHQRPDLDRLYQEAFRLLYGQPGGWPLNLILTPDDQAPFFGFTCLPPTAAEGLPGCAELLGKLAGLFAEQEDQIRDQNTRLLQALRAGPPRHGRTGYSLHAGPLGDVIEQLGQRFDAEHGGFGSAAKFPQVPALERLLRHWWHGEVSGNPDHRTGRMVKLTLERMADGALRHADGGFSRCALRPDWSDPDGERLLADNALLLGLYAQAGKAFNTPRFEQVAAGLAEWLTSRLRDQSGAFATGLIETDDTPLLDDTRRGDWNALAIGRLALAGRLLDRPDWIAAAERALDQLRDGFRHGDDLLDDRVLLLDALLELLQCRWRREDFEFALELADELMDRFQDTSKKGGFYHTADGHEPLVARLKPIHDDALPAANGIAAYCLIRLGHWLGSLRHLLAAERALKHAWPSMEREPTRCCGMLLALEEYYFPNRTVVIRGPNDAIEPWYRACVEAYSPRRMVLAIPDTETGLPEALAVPVPAAGVVAHVCRRGKCSPPIGSLDALLAELATEPVAD
jgi:uncharacterized protein YyaL (SSP411 family)